jgi:hypothetical protein
MQCLCHSVFVPVTILGRLNCGVSDRPPMADALELKLREHVWQRGTWYKGKD